MKSSLLLTGIGLRPPHHHEVLEKRPPVAWLEVHSENYFAEGGPSLQFLEKVRQDYPISLHGVGLSLASADELNWHHARKLRDLAERIDACLVSDHLSWSAINGHYIHDLLPFPYTEETLQHIVMRIQQLQDYLGRQILVENPSQYVACLESTIPEFDFITHVAEQSGCGILLDINNIYVSAMNLDENPHEYVNAIPSHAVQEIHLAGFETTSVNNEEILIDSHTRPIVPAVWDLYRHAINRLGPKPTIVEWDAELPTLETLCLEAFRAEKIMREVHDAAKLAG